MHAGGGKLDFKIQSIKTCIFKAGILWLKQRKVPIGTEDHSWEGITKKRRNWRDGSQPALLRIDIGLGNYYSNLENHWLMPCTLLKWRYRSSLLITIIITEFEDKSISASFTVNNSLNFNQIHCPRNAIKFPISASNIEILMKSAWILARNSHRRQ